VDTRLVDFRRESTRREAAKFICKIEDQSALRIDDFRQKESLLKRFHLDDDTNRLSIV